MSEHDPNTNPSLNEIESNAVVVAHFWLHEAERALIDERIAPKCEAAAMKGFMQAAAMSYLAERQIDAAEKIRDGLLAVADALQCLREPAMIERVAGIETELHRLANTAGDAFMVLTDPARRKGRGDGGK